MFDIKSNLEKLIDLLEKIEQIFLKVEEVRWRKYINECLVQIKKQDIKGIEQFCHSTGGVGSLNDFVIHPMNKHKISVLEINSTNELLQKLISEAFQIAQQIKKDFYSTIE